MKPDNRITFRLPIPEIERLKKLARKEKMTISEYIRSKINDYDWENDVGDTNHLFEATESLLSRSKVNPKE